MSLLLVGYYTYMLLRRVSLSDFLVVFFCGGVRAARTIEP